MTANPLPPIPPISATSGMMPAPGSMRFKPIDPLKVLRQHALLLAAAGVIGVVLGVGLFLALNQLAPRWTSHAQVRISPPIREALQVGTSGPNASLNRDTVEAYMANEKARIESEDLLRQALGSQTVQHTAFYRRFLRPDPNNPGATVFNMQAAVEALKENHLSVALMRGTDLVNISVSTEEEEDAARLLTPLLETYMFRIEQETARNVLGTSSSLVQEQTRLKNEAASLDQQRQQFVQTHDVASLDSRSSAASQEHAQLITTQTQLRSALAQSHEILAGLQAAAQAGGPPSPETRSQIELQPDILQMTYRVNSLREQVDATTAQYGAQHPTTRQIQAQLTAAEGQRESQIQQKIREREAANLEGAQKNIAAIQGQIEALQPRLEEAQRRMTDLNVRLAQYETLTERLNQTRDKLSQVEQSLAEIRIIEKRVDALPVSRFAGPTIAEKTFPKPLVVVPGVTLLVLGLAAGIVFLMELLDQRMKSPADVKLLPDVDLLGVLPDASEDPSATHGIARVVEKHPTGLMAEAYRDVRSGILSKMDRRGYKTLMIVGGQPGCGASSVAQNLASSLAFNGRRVAVVDANFRRPAQHHLYGLSNTSGLVDVLRERATLDKALVPIEGTTIAVLPAGQGAADEAPEVLDSAAFRSLLSSLETSFDTILIDAPPALLASESQLLARHVDALALVIRAQSDKRGMVERLIRRLDGQRADVLGVILNGVRSSAGGYFRKNYRDFYRYRTADNGSRNGSGDSLRRPNVSAGASN